MRVAPVDAVLREKVRPRAVRRKMNGVPTAMKKSLDSTTLLYPKEAKAAGRFRKNVAQVLRGMTYSTPLGRVALRTSAPTIEELREKALIEAVVHNTENPHWHVLVEGPTWVEMGEDACSTLLTVLGGRLPEWMFFEER